MLRNPNSSAQVLARHILRREVMIHLARLSFACALALQSGARPVNAASGSAAGTEVWLSSLDLSKATQGYEQPQADKSVNGHALTLKGQVFAHGFGTHSPGLLALDLAGGAQRFQSTVGVDDEVGAGKGQVEFQIWGDRKLIWKSRLLHSGDAPQLADVSLVGVKRLILRVTTGGTTYEFDHADWADARIKGAGGQPQTVAFTTDALAPVIALTPAPSAPQIHPPAILGLRPGNPLLWTVPVTGARPLSFSARGLPPGLKMNAATGTITGSLARAGEYAFNATARNRFGRDARTLRIIAGPAVALTPPMGWNSYDAYGSNVNEAQVLANARYVAEKMQPYGWDTIVVDYRWYDPNSATSPDNGTPGEKLEMDPDGRLLPPANRFPSAAEGKGFKGLADKIHAMGLRFGVHIMRGIPRNAVAQNLPIDGSTYTASDAANTADTCPWCPDMFGVKGSTPAGQAYYDSIFRLYASWNLDFVKMDDTSAPYHTDEINAAHRAIEKCGRSIIYSLSPGETPVEQARHVQTHANMWRVSGDFWDSWQPLNNEFALGTRWHDYVAPGHWPDGDMLPLGHISLGGRPVGADRQTNFTRAEQMTLLSLWSLLPSPLMVGANLPDNDPSTLALLTNPEVLALNQDALGAPGAPVSQQDEQDVWSKKLADGSLAVGLFNRGDFDAALTADWAKLGISGRYAVRDLWIRQEKGFFVGKYLVDVPRHGAVLLKLTKAR